MSVSSWILSLRAPHDHFLRKVLSVVANAGDMTEAQAIQVIKGALFDNANRIYNLGLQPHYSG